MNASPKVVWSGISSPYALGLSSNINVSRSLQFIPEVNVVLSDSKQTNWTFVTRFTPQRRLSLDFYVSSASGVMDVGQFVKSEDYRVGLRSIISF